MQSTTVIGAGLMGSVLAETMGSSGRPTVVWNRTPEKCAPLAKKGATVAGSAAEAIGASRTTILCISDSAAVLELVTALPGDLELSGRCLVNLSTGGAEDARAIEAQVASRGGRYLAGTILVYPVDIGTPRAVIQYAGAAAAWADVEDLLKVLAPAGTSYLGDDVALPAELDVVLTGSTLGVGLATFIEGAAYATARGVPLDTVVAAVVRILPVLQNEILKAAKEIDAGDFRTTQATLEVWRHAILAYRDAIADQGQPGFLMKGLVASLDHAVDQGFGEAAYTAQFAAARGVSSSATPS